MATDAWRIFRTHTPHHGTPTSQYSQPLLPSSLLGFGKQFGSALQHTISVLQGTRAADRHLLCYQHQVGKMGYAKKNAGKLPVLSHIRLMVMVSPTLYCRLERAISH